MYEIMKRIVKEMCRYDPDGAREKNFIGWNKPDSYFGHEMNAKEFWTIKEAQIIYDMLKKYSNTQLPRMGVDYEEIPIPESDEKGMKGRLEEEKMRKKKENEEIERNRFKWTDLQALNFSDPEMVEKNGEKKIVEKCFDFPKSFWDFYHSNKSKLREMGYSVSGPSRFQSEWSINKWTVIKKTIVEKLVEYILSHQKKIRENIYDFCEKEDYNLEPLYDYQKPHAEKLIKALQLNRVALDGSSTGTGKTFSGCVVARALDVNLAVICPQRVVTDWTETAEKAGTKLLFVSNYALARRGKMRQKDGVYKSGKSKGLQKWKNVDCEYIECEKIPKEQKQSKWDSSYKFTFKVPENTLIIFDEAHRCKNRMTQNSWLLRAAKDSGAMVMMSTATIASNPLKMDATGYALGFHKGKWDFYNWLREHGCEKGNFAWEFQPGYHGLKCEGKFRNVTKIQVMKHIHDEIYGANLGSRMDKRDLVDRGLFPATQVHVKSYNLNGETRKINDAYNSMITELKAKTKEYELEMGLQGAHLKIRQKYRQIVELEKLKLFVDKAKDLIEQDYAVVIFVNYKQTIKAIQEELSKIKELKGKIDTECIITGDVPQPIKEKRQKDFRENRTQLLICTVAAASEAISLHDVNHQKERITLINPDDSAQSIIQVLGRVQRAGGSFSQQYLIYAAGTIEEKVCRNVASKIHNLNALNDGDTNPENFL